MKEFLGYDALLDLQKLPDLAISRRFEFDTKVDDRKIDLLSVFFYYYVTSQFGKIRDSNFENCYFESNGKQLYFIYPSRKKPINKNFDGVKYKLVGVTIDKDDRVLVMYESISAQRAIIEFYPLLRIAATSSTSLPSYQHELEAAYAFLTFILETENIRGFNELPIKKRLLEVFEVINESIT